MLKVQVRAVVPDVGICSDRASDLRKRERCESVRASPGVPNGTAICLGMSELRCNVMVWEGCGMSGSGRDASNGGARGRDGTRGDVSTRGSARERRNGERERARCERAGETRTGARCRLLGCARDHVRSLGTGGREQRGAGAHGGRVARVRAGAREHVNGEGCGSAHGWNVRERERTGIQTRSILDIPHSRLSHSSTICTCAGTQGMQGNAGERASARNGGNSNA